MEISRQELAKMIAHTQIKPTATKDDIAKLCKEAGADFVKSGTILFKRI